MSNDFLQNAPTEVSNDEPSWPVLPTSYSLPTTKEEVQQLLADPHTRPPAELRQKLWWDTEGLKEWERRQHIAKTIYDAERAEYKKDCEAVTETNRKIEDENDRCELEYELAKEFYASEMRIFNTRRNPAAIVESLTALVQRELSREKKTVETTVKRVWDASEKKMSAEKHRKADEVIFSLLFSRFARFKKLLEQERGAFCWRRPKDNSPFITDITEIKSPLIYVPDHTSSKLTGYRLSAVCRLDELHDISSESFYSLWQIIEATVLKSWQKEIGVSLDDNWCITPSARKKLQSWGEFSSHVFGGAFYLSHWNNYLKPTNFQPKPPERPKARPSKSMPIRPVYEAPTRPEPPPHCYDASLLAEQRVVLQGAFLQNIEHNLTEARRRLFSEGNRKPYFLFGGLPFTFHNGETRHFLCIGQSGSGKTTIMRHLMSAFLPLTSKQVAAIRVRTPTSDLPKPRSAHEWSRSHTFQAVVYNAKSEYVPTLEAFGFNADAGEGTDLIILDPNDSRCFSWDIAADIESVPDAENLAAMLVPIKSNAEGDDKDAVWQLQARRLITAVIISLRRMTMANKGRQTWNLWDVIRACGTQKRLRHVLRYHDTADEIAAQLLDLSDAQKSSIYMSATAYISQFDTIAKQWFLAEQRGRCLSLKEWSKNGRGTILVLPNTPDNDSYGPLNRALVAAVSKLFLSDDNTFYRDAQGSKRAKTRFVFMDEFGAAGHLPDVGRLFTQGRSFGVSIVAGLQEISSLEAVYGENVSDTILGQFTYKACLKSASPKTQEWMSKQFGERLEKLTKDTVSEQTSHDTTTSSQQSTTANLSHGMNANLSESKSDSTGKQEGKNKSSSHTSTSDPRGYPSRSNQTGTNEGTSEQHTKGTQATIGAQIQSSSGTSDTSGTSTRDGTTDGKSTTWELRKDFNIYPSDFGQFSSPTSTGRIAGAYMAPSLDGWRADLPFAVLEPELERAEALDSTSARASWPDKWEASRPGGWEKEDYERLGMELPQSIVALPSNQEPQFPSHKTELLSDAERPRSEDLGRSHHLDDFQFEE